MAIDSIIKTYGKALSKGIIAQEAPKIAKGALVESLKLSGVTLKGATDWVQANVCFWDILEEAQQRGLIRLYEMGGRLNWLTAEWFIQAIKVDFPSVASLFLGWKKANNWLKRQVLIIRERVES